eukprot:CAMPEP_0170747358 /NCGR_PEP_ID=MMETSP0437-20130122/9279_1 /TAXON_ID=0 /ORGANISM="Sexangularia sp." /LENGTH=319 /DNA_ID=CAMNT_0011086129 /DNA_START=90 /DNA_END=1046 /DNA_ORIENTATION=-
MTTSGASLTSPPPTIHRTIARRLCSTIPILLVLIPVIASICVTVLHVESLRIAKVLTALLVTTATICGAALPPSLRSLPQSRIAVTVAGALDDIGHGLLLGTGLFHLLPDAIRAHGDPGPPVSVASWTIFILFNATLMWEKRKEATALLPKAEEDESKDALLAAVAWRKEVRGVALLTTSLTAHAAVAGVAVAASQNVVDVTSLAWSLTLHKLVESAVLWQSLSKHLSLAWTVTGMGVYCISTPTAIIVGERLLNVSDDGELSPVVWVLLALSVGPLVTHPLTSLATSSGHTDPHGAILLPTTTQQGNAQLGGHSAPSW